MFTVSVTFYYIASWLSDNSTSIYGTPGPSDVGAYDVCIRAVDGSGTVIWQNYTVHVIERLVPADWGPMFASWGGILIMICIIFVIISILVGSGKRW